MNWLTDYEKNKEDVFFGWTDKGSVAMLVLDNKIVINLECALASAYIHERLHAIFPRMREEKIEQMEQEHFKRMKVRDIKRLAARLVIRWINSLEGG